MSEIEIVRRQEIGFDAHGQSVSVDHTFVKLSLSMRNLLRSLQGARLSAFFLLALNEAEICLGRGGPLSIYAIAEETNTSPRNVLRAMQYLVKNNFGTQVPERGPNGEKLYRVSGYAWFGEPRRLPPPASHARSDKMSDSDKNIIGMTEVTPGMTNLTPGMTNVAPGGGEGGGGKPSPEVRKLEPDFSSKERRDLPSPPQPPNLPEVHARVRAILSGAGIWGNALEKLAATVNPERAERWARWICWANQEARDKYSSPAGLARFRLLRDPDEDPEPIPEESDAWEEPDDAPVEQPDEEAPPVAEHGAGGKRTAQDVWQETVEDLRLAMARAPFETWVRPTTALGWDGGVLVVRVHNPYAKEWLESRLEMTVKRVLAGVLGRSAEIRYETR